MIRCLPLRMTALYHIFVFFSTFIPPNMQFSVVFPPRVTSKLQITIFSGTQTWVNPQDDVRLHAVCLEYLEGLCSWKSQHGHHLVRGLSHLVGGLEHDFYDVP
jgi:hypothetical protein